MTIALNHPRRIIAAGVTLALVALALLPGTWGTAIAQTAGTTTATATPSSTPVISVITNPGAQQVTTTISGTQTAAVGDSTRDGGASLTIPANAMPPGSTVTVNQAPRRTGSTFVDTKTATVTIESFMSLEAVDAQGNPIENFDAPVTVRVNVPNATWGVVNGLTRGNPTVKVKNTNNATTPPTVTEVTCTIVDAANGVVDCELPHFSDWELEISFPVDEGVDAADVAPGEIIDAGGTVPSPADTGMGVTEESGATNPLAIALGVLALAGILGAGARFAMGRRSA